MDTTFAAAIEFALGGCCKTVIIIG